MFERPLRFLAVLVSVIVVASFAMFAIDEFRGASNETQTAIAAQTSVHAVTTPTGTSERLREQRHSQAREAIDDLNDVATAPFDSLVAHSPSTWVRHGVPALLALIFFGLGFAFLARFAKGTAHAHRRPVRRAGV